jgi:MFS family permease
MLTDLPVMGLLGTILSWFLLLRFGRRTIYLTGLAALVILQLVIGILDCVPGRPSTAIWAEACLMLLWNFVYDLTIGPVCFVIISEVSATRVRSKTIALATAVQGVFGILMTVAIPYLIAPDQAALQGKLGFVFAALAALCLLWAWVRVPETGGRTYEELDILFERRVPAGDFSGYVTQ